MKAEIGSRKSSRRAFLRGMGTCVALPALEARAARGTAAPLRIAFLMIPNGVNGKRWRPEGTGRDFKLGETFRPLAPLRDKIQIYTGFAHDNANAKGDGPGDHARANATFLTGCHALKTAGANIKLGVSVDQIAARRLGHATRIASLELGTEKSRRTGSCDNGYSCSYQYNVSWASETAPRPPEADPRAVFERLFGAGPPTERQRSFLARQRQRKSLVDFVLEDARAMNARLGANDRRKMDEYLASVRAIEGEIEKAERFALPRAKRPAPETAPLDHAGHIRLMLDLLAVAFETDQTRVATFPLVHDGSNRSFAEIGIPEGHHHLSHHQRDPEKLEKIAQIDLFYMEQLAHFLERLDAARDVDGRSVLANAMVLYGGAIGDGDRHNHDDLPLVLAGGGGGKLRPGRHVALPAPVPLTNLFLTMLDLAGAPTETLGDSTGRFEDV